MRHINDQTLDQLLQDSLGEQEERALEVHIQQCHTCAARLREWEVLFPQIRGVAPAGEEFAPELAMATPRSSVVILPDWTPPPAAPQLPRSRPSALWLVVLVLGVAAAWLALRNRSSESDEPTMVANDPQLPGRDTLAGALGSGLGDSTRPTAFAESAAAHAQQRETALVPDPIVRDSEPAAETDSTILNRSVASAPPPAQETEDSENRPAVTRGEEPARFPIKSTDKTPPVSQPNPPQVNQPTGATRSTPLPRDFTRVTLGEAIARLGGPVRLIDGMTPEAVEVASGAALPGADPNHAVVRVIYNSPTGRIILDQQRLDRGGPQEPDIAINTAASGVSVAQWIDWKGYWISLASRTNQEALLAIANRIRESP